MSTRLLRIVSLSHSDSVDFEASPVPDLKYAISRVFNCWHTRMSRPVTHGRETYRACLRCGMRRKFDLQTWKSTGRYYSPSVDRRND